MVVTARHSGILHGTRWELCLKTYVYNFYCISKAFGLDGDHSGFKLRLRVYIVRTRMSQRRPNLAIRFCVSILDYIRLSPESGRSFVRLFSLLSVSVERCAEQSLSPNVRMELISHHLQCQCMNISGNKDCSL